MTVVGMDLLPRDAELARRAAAAMAQRLCASTTSTRPRSSPRRSRRRGRSKPPPSATQTAFLRVLRWPPALGAPDGDVAELLCALALGGSNEPTTGSFDDFDTEDARDVARLVGVGWLRSETVAKAGARFDQDWSLHLWTAAAGAGAGGRAASDPAASRRLSAASRRPAPPAAVAAVLVLVLFAGGASTILAGGETEPMEADPAAATPEPEAKAGETQKPLRTRRAERRAEREARESRLLRDKTVQPLLAP